MSMFGDLKTASSVRDPCVLEDDLNMAGFKVGSFPVGHRQCGHFSSVSALLCQLSGYTAEETMALLAPSSILAAAVMVF